MVRCFGGESVAAPRLFFVLGWFEAGGARTTGKVLWLRGRGTVA